MEDSPVYQVLENLKKILVLKLAEMESDTCCCVLKKETFKMGVEKIHFLQSLIIQNQL